MPVSVLEDPITGPLGFPRFDKIGDTFPTFVPEASVPVNVEDTIAVVFDPLAKMRYARFDFQTPLDYDLAEMEFFADGFHARSSLYLQCATAAPSNSGKDLLG